MTIVKVNYNGDIRRLGKLEPATYEGVVQLVRDAWPEVVASGLRLKYKDDEGDLCMLTAMTMQDALDLKDNSAPLRLELHQALAPVAPVAPGAPASPGAPAGPVAPGVPAAPGPVAPVAPVAPAAPGVQAGPVAPGMTAAPAGGTNSTGSTYGTGCSQPISLPAKALSRRTAIFGGNAVDLTLSWSVWSVWPTAHGGACASVQADVSPWCPGAQLEIQLPAECEVTDPWNVTVAKSTANGIFTVTLAAWPTTCFGGTFSFPMLDPCTAGQKLMAALHG